MLSGTCHIAVLRQTTCFTSWLCWLFWAVALSTYAASDTALLQLFLQHTNVQSIGLSCIPLRSLRLASLANTARNCTLIVLRNRPTKIVPSAPRSCPVQHQRSLLQFSFAKMCPQMSWHHICVISCVKQPRDFQSSRCNFLIRQHACS